jgi:glycosyltransferase involved in cell wall biosynthesis
MESLLILFCYNRPNILKQCIESMFNNTNHVFDEVLLINDGSQPEVTQSIMSFVLSNAAHPKTKFSLMHFGKNQGYSYAAEFAFNYAKWRNPKYLFFIEQDYIFRQGWAEEALAVLRASPKTVCISGYSNPDFFDVSKTEQMFPRIIKEDFGDDPCKREHMHTPFELETEAGKILVQGTSNSCGTCIINWQNLMAFDGLTYGDFWTRVIERACNMQPGGNRNNYGDGPFSHGISYFWYNHYLSCEKFGVTVDFSKEFPWLDICDFSIGNHINGGEESINGKIVAEGQTFVGSPKWNPSFKREL